MNPQDAPESHGPNDPDIAASSQRLPPLPHRQHRSRGVGGYLPGGVAGTLPLLLSLGGGLAALWLLEEKNHTVSRSARRARDASGEWLHDAGEWAGHAGAGARRWARDTGESLSDRAGHWRESLSDGLIAAGAKTAGLAGILGALGGGKLSTGARRAGKLMAAKKLAEYVGPAVRGLGDTVHRHGGVSGIASAGAQRARYAGREGGERVRDAYRVLRGGRTALPRERDHGIVEAAVIGAALIGVGLGAAYLFDPASGSERRRALRLRAQAARRQTSEWAHDLAERAREATGGAGAAGQAGAQEKE